MPSESNNRSESISLSRIVRNSSSIGDTKANLIIFVFGVCARVGGSHARAPFASASRRRGRGDSLVLAPAPIGSINGSWSVQQRAARLVASNHNKRAKVSGTCPLRQWTNVARTPRSRFLSAYVHPARAAVRDATTTKRAAATRFSFFHFSFFLGARSQFNIQEALGVAIESTGAWNPFVSLRSWIFLL